MNSGMQKFCIDKKMIRILYNDRQWELFPHPLSTENHIRMISLSGIYPGFPLDYHFLRIADCSSFFA